MKKSTESWSTLYRNYRGNQWPLLTSFLIPLTQMTLPTLIIQAVCSAQVTYGLRWVAKVVFFLYGPEFFFRPYFPYCLGSVHHCEHRFHICFFVRSSHTWFSYIYSHSSFLFYWLTFCLFRLRDEKMKFHINLEVQLLLKQGQVSVLQSHQTNPVLTGSSPSLCCDLGGGYTRLLYHRLYRQCSDSSLCCRGP